MVYLKMYSSLGPHESNMRFMTPTRSLAMLIFCRESVTSSGLKPIGNSTSAGLK